MGEVPYDHVNNQTLWNPANLAFPVGGYYHPLEAPTVKNARQNNSSSTDITRTNSNDSTIPQSTPPVTPTNNTDHPEADIKFGEPKGTVDISGVRRGIAEEMVDELDKNNKGLVEGGVQQRLAIRNMMSSIADKHHLPVAYVIKDGRVKLLTRPPENITKDKRQGRIYFLNTTTGREENEELTTAGNGRDESVVYLSGLPNFPEGASDVSSGFFTDYEKANDYLKSIGYDLSGFELPASETVENKDGAWADDIVIANAFAMAAIAQKQENPQSEESGESFSAILAKNGDQMTHEFIKIYDPKAYTENNKTKIDPDVAKAIVNALASVDINAVEGAKYIQDKLDTIAYGHNLAIAYVLDGDRLRILTRPPELVDDTHSKIFYFDPQFGTEKEMIVPTDNENSEKHKIYFSAEANFGDVDNYHSVQNDHKLAAEFLQQVDYGYTTQQKADAVEYEKDEGIPKWALDLIIGLSYAKTVKETTVNHKSAAEILDELRARIDRSQADEQ
jgi:hypothetical protein